MEGQANLGLKYICFEVRARQECGHRGFVTEIGPVVRPENRANGAVLSKLQTPKGSVLAREPVRGELQQLRGKRDHSGRSLVEVGKVKHVIGSEGCVWS